MQRFTINLIVLTATILTQSGNNRAQQETSPISQKCLTCLCEAVTSCDLKAECKGAVCGPFRISWGYWADAGKPTINGESPEEADAYKNCALDANCAAQAVQGYMHKFQQDCNGDGKIDCDDFAIIHRYGGYGCKGGLINEAFGERYYQCKTILGQ